MLNHESTSSQSRIDFAKAHGWTEIDDDLRGYPPPEQWSYRMQAVKRDIPVPGLEPSEAHTHCKNCGSKNDADANTCVFCGTIIMIACQPWFCGSS